MVLWSIWCLLLCRGDRLFGSQGMLGVVVGCGGLLYLIGRKHLIYVALHHITARRVTMNGKRRESAMSSASRSYGSGTYVGIAVLCFVAYLKGVILYDHYRISLAEYEQTVGIVIASRVDQRLGGGGTRNRQTKFAPDVTYSYAVDGLTYQGNNRDSLSVSSASAEWADAQAIVSRYRPGAEIEIWYRASNPQISVVNIEEKKTLRKLVLASGFTLFGIWVIWLDRWSVRTRQARTTNHQP